MADLTTAIQIILSGGDTVSAGLHAVGGAMGELGGIATNLAGPFADVAKYVEILDAAFIGLATVAIVKAAKEATTFQSSLLDLQKQMDDTEGSATDQAAVLEALAQKYSENANGLVSSTADFKAAGYDMDTSIKLVTSSLDLMIAGGVKTSEAVDVINRSLAGFQVPASEVVTEAQHIGDVLNKTADLTKSSFHELAIGYADFSSTAKLTNLTSEQTAAILSKVIDVFGSGSEAANSLKSGFLALLNPSKEATSEMQALEISVTDSSGKFKSVKDILAELAPAFNTLTDSQKLHVAAVLFGTEQAGKFVQVLGTYDEAMALSKKLTDEAGGSIEKEVTIRLQSAEVQFNRTAEAVRQLNVHLGLQFLDAAAGASGGVTELVNAFKALVDNGSLDPFINLIEQAATRIGTTLRAMAENLPQAFAAVDFSGLLSSIDGLGDELDTLFRALFGDIDLTTVEGLASALQTVVNIGESLTLTTQGIIRAFEPFAASIGETVRHFNDLDAASKVDFGTFIGDMQAIVIAGGLVGSAIIGLGQATIELSPIFDAVFGGVKVTVNALQVTFDAVVLGMLNIKKALLEAGLAAAEFSQKFAFTDAAKTQNQNAIDGFKASLESLGVTMDGVAANLDRNKTELEQGWAQATGTASDKTDGLRQRLDAAKASLTSNRDEIVKNNSAMQDWSTGLQQSQAKIEANTARLMDWSDGLQKASGHLKEVGVSQEALSKDEGLDKNIQKVQVYDEALGKLVTVYGSTSDAAIKATGSFAAVGASASDQAKKVDEATKKSQEYQLKMEEIASNERIKIIEAKVTLNVAELEAQTKQVEAAFDSISTTINSTGDLLGSLFGNLAGADAFTKLEIIEQIEAENKRRDAALELQRKLTEAEIENVQAKTRALDRGDSLIKIDGTGLAPQLEAFMWEVLKAIEVRANATYLEYLQGLPA